MDDRDRRQPHVAAHHDGAGAFIHDDLGWRTEIDGEVLHPRNEDGHGLSATLGNIDVDTIAVEGSGDCPAKLVVNHVGDVARRGKVGVEQQ